MIFQDGSPPTSTITSLIIAIETFINSIIDLFSLQPMIVLFSLLIRPHSQLRDFKCASQSASALSIRIPIVCNGACTYLSVMLLEDRKQYMSFFGAQSCIFWPQQTSMGAFKKPKKAPMLVLFFLISCLSSQHQVSYWLKRKCSSLKMAKNASSCKDSSKITWKCAARV